MDTQYQWVQAKFGDKVLSLRKVKGAENTADFQTKYLSAKDTERIMQQLGFVAMAGKRQVAINAAV